MLALSAMMSIPTEAKLTRRYGVGLGFGMRSLLMVIFIFVALTSFGLSLTTACAEDSASVCGLVSSLIFKAMWYSSGDDSLSVDSENSRRTADAWRSCVREGFLLLTKGKLG